MRIGKLSVRRFSSGMDGRRSLCSVSGSLRRTVDHGPASPAPVAGRRAEGSALGFTLLELMMVLTLLLTIISFATPIYQTAIIRAREAVLRDDLYVMRSLIDQFTLDKQRPPQSLEELVEAGYLRGGVPVDPFTRSNQTWQVVIEDVVTGPSQAVPGIVDVHSGSEEMSLDETPYSSW